MVEKTAPGIVDRAIVSRCDEQFKALSNSNPETALEVGREYLTTVRNLVPPEKIHGLVNEIWPTTSEGR